MKTQKILLLLLLFPLVINLVHAQIDETIFDLNHLTHIQTISHKELPVKIGSYVDYIKIPKEAQNINLTNNLNLNISYNLYCEDEQNLLLSSVADCNTDYSSKMDMLPDEIFNTILLEFPDELQKHSSIILNLQYDLPYQTETIKVFRNSINLANSDGGKVIIKLPENSKMWDKSQTPLITEKNNQMILSWENVDEKLRVTYGTTEEYLFYELKKDSILNNFTSLWIIIFTVFLSFLIYFKSTKSYHKKVSGLFKFYGIISLFLFALFVWMPYFEKLIPPFANQYTTQLFIRIGVIIAISILTFFLTKSKKVIGFFY